MPDDLAFGRWLRERRKALDLTQEALGERVGCAAETIRRYEAERLRPSREVAARLAAVLDLPPEERTAFVTAARTDQLPASDGLLPPLGSPVPHNRQGRPDLPTGTVTLVFTDLEGSTQLLQRLGARYDAMLAEYRHLVRAVFTEHGGHEVDTQGDAFFFAFSRARDATAAAIAAQQALARHPWPEGVTLGTRMGLHTGEPRRSAEGYIGLDVVRAARLVAAGHGGQVLLTEATQVVVAQDLPDSAGLRDLGGHQLKDLPHPERIFQLVVADLPGQFPPLNTLGGHAHNLPVQRERLIGREREVVAVHELLLCEDVGLVTLTGPGGIGKTRLGLQVAAELLPAFADGVCFINLAPISDPDLVAVTMAQTLGVQEHGSQPMRDRLRTALRDKQLLLLLDNFEQVAAAAPLIAELLSAAPRLKVLVTSRAVLHLQGEHEVRVPPLALPDPAQRHNLATLADCAAVALFIRRAHAVTPDVALNGTAIGVVADICARLDGLPLAIELAAPRMKLLSPQALLARLDRRLALLTDGPRDLPSRQQTLRATIDWSYRLLTADEQRLFERLAVFAGSWTLDAAEAVCGAVANQPGLPITHDPRFIILNGLASLVDQSLIQQHADGEGALRFGMLETIREYALDRLAERGDTVAARHSHAGYFARSVELLASQMHRGGFVTSVAMLDADYHNLRAALHWSLQAREYELAACIAGSLREYWDLRGLIAEGRSWSVQLLHPSVALPQPLRGHIQANTGHLLYRLGQLEEAASLAATVVADPQSTIEAICFARRVASLAVMETGDLAGARRQFDQMMELAQEHALGFDVAAGQFNVGLICMVQGQFREAETFFRACHGYYDAIQHPRLLGIVRVALGYLAVLGDEDKQAATLLRDGLQQLIPVRETVYLLYGLLACCGLAMRQGQPLQAAILFGAATHHADQMGLRVMRGLLVLAQRHVGQARAQMAAEAFDQALRRGQALSLDEAVALAQTVL